MSGPATAPRTAFTLFISEADYSNREVSFRWLPRQVIGDESGPHRLTVPMKVWEDLGGPREVCVLVEGVQVQNGAVAT